MADSAKQLKILSENSEILKKRLCATEEQRAICVEQIARINVNMGAELGVDGTYDKFCRALSEPSSHDKAYICKQICETGGFLRELEEKNLFGVGDEASAEAKGRIAYVRNKRNDDVFLEFSRMLVGAKAYYATSFADACEAVFNNACEYCILPIDNNKEGRLFSFYSLLDKYELRICEAVRTEEEDTAESIVFALAGRRIEKISSRRSGMTRFEFSLTREEKDILEDIITVSGFLSGKISALGTLPVPYDDSKIRYYFSIDFEEKSPIPMALYLSMEYPRYTPIGLYKIT